MRPRDGDLSAMSASRDVIAALVAGGMDPIDASTLVARAAVEMTSIVIRKSPGAKRQERWRERNKPSQNVSRDVEKLASRNVSNRLETSQCNGTEKSPLTSLLSSDHNNQTEKKESKKERSPKKRDGPLPPDWKPPDRSIALAAEHGASVPQVEAIFRDYLASSGKRYADYDAAFCNFVRNQKNFTGGRNGERPHRNRAASPGGAGSTAATRETDFVTAVGNGALNYLEKRASARQGGAPSGGGDVAGEHDDFDLAEDAT